jgi:hypothetical protein
MQQSVGIDTVGREGKVDEDPCDPCTFVVKQKTCCVLMFDVRILGL